MLGIQAKHGMYNLYNGITIQHDKVSLSMASKTTVHEHL